MSVAERQAAPRRHGPAQRAARPRPDALGRRRARRATGRSRSPPAASRGCGVADGVPGVRGVVRLAEAVVVIPLVKAAAARGAAAVPGPGGDRRRRRRARSPEPRCAAARPGWPAEAVARRDVARPRGLRAARRRARRVPRRRAQGDRRLRVGRRRRAATPARSTTAAARISWRRCSPPTSPARCCCAARWRRRARSRRAPSRSPPRRDRGRGVRVVRAQRGTTLARALRRPGLEIQRLLGTREPDEHQLEVGRAALAEILRVEGAASGL